MPFANPVYNFIVVRSKIFNEFIAAEKNISCKGGVS